MQSTLQRFASKHSILYPALQHAVFPALFYFAAFCILSFPLIGKFFSHYYGGSTDGLQNVWNIWWVNLAVHRPDLYPSIWYTPLLHWPWGTSLRDHTLSPFSGYLGVLLQMVFSLKTSYNLLVLFPFLMSGVTMYWLAYRLTRAFWPATIAGFLFTFSDFHFGHGLHQLNTGSMEWIPVFLLCWLILLTRPSPLAALGAAVGLWLVILCDYYYFLYCVLAAVLVFLWYALRERSLRFLARREHLIPLALFAGAALLLVGPLVGAFLVGNAVDPAVGGHDAASFSLDLLGLLIPGPTWLFSRWTAGYWSRLPGTLTENDVFLSLPVFVLMAYVWVKRKALDPETRQQLTLWSLVFAFFFLLALGPVLHIAGTAVWDRLMPYSMLSALLPFLSVSGVPARMVSMISLAAAALSAFGLRELFARFPQQRLLTFGLLAVILFETLPGTLPATPSVAVPAYITALAALPDDGGVLNLVKTGPGLQLFYETVHRKPIAFGYLARLPSSVVRNDEELSNTIVANDYARLWSVYRIRYIATSDPLSARPDQPLVLLDLVYQEKGIRIYHLGCSCEPGN